MRREWCLVHEYWASESRYHEERCDRSVRTGECTFRTNDTVVPDDIDIAKLKKLLRDATKPGCEGHDSWIICPPCDALRSLERMAPRLADRVAADAKVKRKLAKALQREQMRVLAQAAVLREACEALEAVPHPELGEFPEERDPFLVAYWAWLREEAAPALDKLEAAK